MLRRTAIWSLGALAALLLIDRASLFLPPCSFYPTDNQANNKSADNDYCAAREGIIIAGVETLYSLKPEVLTALGTIAIATFTLTLWLATGRQARLTREAIELGNREFIATHRPRLAVRHFFFDGIVPGEPIRIYYQVVNRGDTDGRIIRTAFDAWFK